MKIKIKHHQKLSCVKLNQLPTSKWKDKKYGRTERNKRIRERSLYNGNNRQNLITYFYPILDKIGMLMEENYDLKKYLMMHNHTN